MGALSGRGLPSRLGRSHTRFGRGSGGAVGGERSPSAQHWRKWYSSKRWADLRRAVLLRDGYACRQTGVPLVGRPPAANSPVVDHIVPHRGDPDLFWDEANLQAVSKAWHDREKQRQERADPQG